MTHYPDEARRLRVNAQGRTVIPADFRRAMGLRDEDELVAWLEGERLIISTRRAVASSTSGMYRHLGRGAVEGLIAERRAEARRENEESPTSDSAFPEEERHDNRS